MRATDCLRTFAVAALAATAALGAAGAAVAQTTFTNATPITIPAGAGAGGSGQPFGSVASPYPSIVSVSGLSGTVSSLSVRLNGLSADSPNDVVIVLVAPDQAHHLVLLSDAGGFSAVSGATLTFSDAAGNQLPDSVPFVSGTWRPTGYNAGVAKDNFPAPAPSQAALVYPAPYGSATLASQFNGVGANGPWSLYVIDDESGPPTGSGISIAGGWSLIVTTAVKAQPTTTTLDASPNPSFTSPPGDLVTFTASVTSGGNAVGTGSVTFREEATILAGPIPVNGSGMASFSTASLSEGAHVVTADYSGATGFGPSSGSTTQVVNRRTVQNGSTFCNPGALSIDDGGAPATPYPSNLFVSNLVGTITGVELALSGVTTPRPDDLELLLVGPNGAAFVPLSDAGGLAPVGPLAVTLADAAASLVPLGGPLAAGTYRPTSAGAPEGVSFPAPAPAPAYARPAPAGADTLAGTFGGVDPNGTWSLYAVDDTAGGGASSFAGGWCLSFSTTAAGTTTTTLVSSPNPSFTSAPGDLVTFTAQVKRVSDGGAVTSGAVTFREGGLVLAGPVALDGLGRAQLATATLAEGAHTVHAEYGGSPGLYAQSSAETTQIVDDRSVSIGDTVCNPGPLPVGDAGTGTPYPARLFVSGRPNGIATLSLALLGLTHPRPDDLDVLLVGPSGAQIVPLSDVGGVFAASGVNLDLDDAAANQLADAGPLASGTFRPTSAGAPGTDAFPVPAPGPPYAEAAPAAATTFASAFGDSDPNGTWSVFVADDATGEVGSIADGVCLSFTDLPDADADGAVDAHDNCPSVANPDQSDAGGVGAGSAPDGIGDACQCGDVTGDGVVTPSDAAQLQRALLAPPAASLARPDHCDVGGSAGCSPADAAIVRRALLVPPTASIEQRCVPALP